jgi:hypothetical protein
LKQLAIYGIGGGILIAAMQFFEYRFLVIEHSIEIYSALVAAAFAAAALGALAVGAVVASRLLAGR